MLLVSRREAMPKRLKQLAAFALAHPEEMAFGTVAGIAEHAGVQPSTLVRFAKSLGYDGFSHLQQLFRDRLRERFPDYRERLRGLRDAEGDHVARSVAARRFHSQPQRFPWNGCATRLRPEELSRAIDVLARADTIYLLGARRVFPVSAYCAYAFGKLGRPRHSDRPRRPTRPGAARRPQRTAGRRARDQLHALCAGHGGTRRDWRRGATFPWWRSPISAFSPLVSSADVWLEVAEADFGAFRSLSASFALAMALAVGTAEKRAER